MNSLFQHDIPKRQSSCSKHGERFPPESEIYSLLYEDETNGKLARQDFCINCWKEVQKEKKLPLKKTSWKSKIEKKHQLPSSSNRIQKALVLLKDLRNNPNSSEQELFVLCLFLAHAKQLALRKEIKKENDLFFLYEVLGQEAYFTIKAFELTQAQIECLQQTIASKLKM